MSRDEEAAGIASAIDAALPQPVLTGRPLNLLGVRYGKLRVVARVENAPGGFVRWSCKCDCGGRSVVRTGNLRSGAVQSCGCERRNAPRRNVKPIAAGSRFGALVVIARAGSSPDCKALWACRCDCGTPRWLVEGKLLRNGNTQSCGCLRGVRRPGSGRKDRRPTRA